MESRCNFTFKANIVMLGFSVKTVFRIQTCLFRRSYQTVTEKKFQNLKKALPWIEGFISP